MNFIIVQKKKVDRKINSLGMRFVSCKLFRKEQRDSLDSLTVRFFLRWYFVILLNDFRFDQMLV